MPPLFGNGKAQPFAGRLAAFLHKGAAALPSGFLVSVRRSLCTMQDKTGLFRGRSGAAPDLYYTAFGVKALELLGHAWCIPCRARLLAQADALFRDVPDRASLSDLYCWLEIRRVLTRRIASRAAPIAPRALVDKAQSVLASHRGSDGAYARTPGQQPSAQGLFLGILCEQMLGMHSVGAEFVQRFFCARLCRDGGFSEAPEEASGTTSAAAVAAVLLSETRANAPDLMRNARNFLLRMQTETGGFKAHASTPAADLLSTFTALIGLAAAGMDCPPRAGMIARFVRDCGTPNMSFRAAPRDRGPGDPEYAYYGVGALAHLAQCLASTPE